MKTRGIYIGPKKTELNKWQFCFILESCPPWMCDCFCPYIKLHFAKFNQKPALGAIAVRGLDYKGFIWSWYFPTHYITIRRYTFVVPYNRLTRLLYKMGFIRHRVYAISYPIGFKFNR